MKTCTKCKIEKEITEFSKDRTTKDGLQLRCIPCRAAHRKATSKAIREYKAGHRAANHAAVRAAEKAYETENKTTRHARHVAYACGPAAPVWLTEEHHTAMQALYEEAAEGNREEPSSVHVDHIVPRNHKLVSGLHVPANLQLLPKEENIRKKNYLPLEPEFSFLHQHDGKAYDTASGQLVTIK